MKKLTKSQRRVAIVRDAITQLEIGSYKTGDFGYLSLSSQLKTKCDKTISAQEALTNINEQSYCGVCAKGGLLLSVIRKENEFNSADLISDSFMVMERLTRDDLFSKDNLNLIEAYYEGRGWVVHCYDYFWGDCAGGGFGGYLKKSGHLDNISKFEIKYPSEENQNRTKRLLAILDNMEKNEGIFSPKMEKL